MRPSRAAWITPNAVASLPAHADGRDRHPGAVFDMLVDHLPGVHPVDVVRTEDDHEVGPLVVDQVQRLVDRVRRPRVPVRAEPLLSGHRRHVVAEQIAHPPGGGDVPVEAVALVLGEHADAQAAGVDQVREGEVDQPVQAAERHGRLGPVRGERCEPLALPAGEHDPQHSRLRPSHTSLSTVSMICCASSWMRAR